MKSEIAIIDNAVTKHPGMCYPLPMLYQNTLKSANDSRAIRPTASGPITSRRITNPPLDNSPFGQLENGQVAS